MHLLIPLYESGLSKFLRQVTVPWTPRQRRNRVGARLSRRFVRVHPPSWKTLIGKGASSLVGGFSHSVVLFDEQPDKQMRSVRAKALRSFAAKARAVVGRGVWGM